MAVFFYLILKNRGEKEMRNAGFRNGSFGNVRRVKNEGFQAKTDISVWDFWGTSRGGRVSAVRRFRRCPTGRRSRLHRE